MEAIVVEVFVAPDCSCVHEPLRKNLERISNVVRDKYGIALDVMILPIHARRAGELGITMANSIALNGQKVFEGNFSAGELQQRIEQLAGGKRVG